MARRKPITHGIRTVDPSFGQINCRQMSFLIVFDDKDYSTGDVLRLNEYAYDKPTGESITRKIKHILRRNRGLQFGYVVLGLE